MKRFVLRIVLCKCNPGRIVKDCGGCSGDREADPFSYQQSNHMQLQYAILLPQFAIRGLYIPDLCLINTT